MTLTKFHHYLISKKLHHTLRTLIVSDFEYLKINMKNLMVVMKN